MPYLYIRSKRIIETPQGQKEIPETVAKIKITKNGGWYVQFPLIPYTDFQVYAEDGKQLPVIE